jgi:peptidoglycan biosynthesis protein MviN/MurJ (putative lipid II flippase)
MLLKAGALSLGLLLASRVLGLLRETGLAATFGISGMADVAVLMLTLPDWVAGVLASGALAYALLPAWVGREPAQVAAIQRRVARILLASGIALAAVLAVLREPAAGWLAGGLAPGARLAAAQALVWSALAVPAALLAALWITRLQHERDFVGMYSANIVVNLVLLAAIGAVAAGHDNAQGVAWLGCGLLAAMGLRLAWLRWRQPARMAAAAGEGGAVLPRASVWLWAVLSAGLPLALPFVARSLASRSGEGALATFNYAWKLVELPLLLAIQLVATLAFPAIAQALSKSGASAPHEAGTAVRTAFGLAFALACACAAGLLAGAPALASLLFGWGRMEPAALEHVARWARTGAWGLLPQAIIAVGLTVLAAQDRMKSAVLAYALALAALLVLGASGVTDGGALMAALNVLLAGVAAATVIAVGAQARRWLPWRVLGGSLAMLLVLAFGLPLLPASGSVPLGLVVAAVCAGLVLATAWLAGPELRPGAAHNPAHLHD